MFKYSLPAFLLLITHGGIDDNVNPSATFKLADALIKADKQFGILSGSN